jgi:hypothetical protein
MNDTAIDKNKTYTFSFSSASGTQVAGNNNQITYNVDWGVMPNQPYLVYFTYLGEVNTIDGLTIPMVYADLLASTNVFEAQFQPVALPTGRTQATRTNYLGILKYKSIGASSFLYADADTNPPIYMATRPMNNQPRIEILSNTPGQLYNPQAADLGQYVITMHFVPANSKLLRL